MKLQVIVLLVSFSLLYTASLGAPLFNLSGWLQNFRLLRRDSGSGFGSGSGSKLDEEEPFANHTNLTKEELYKLIRKFNFSRPIEPPPDNSGSGDDESGYPPNCTENEFACKDGGCIPMNKECDESFDCEDKSDEDKSYCEEKNKNKCGQDQFKCDSGKPECISIYHRCDGDKDCSDGSDEDVTRCLEIKCPRPNNIHCPSNGVCIETVFLCDDIMDCPDNWDEKYCPPN